MKADGYPYISHHAETAAEIAAYYRDQAVRLASYDVMWNRRITPVTVANGLCYRTKMTWQGRVFASYYLPASQRGKGVFQQAVAQESLPILTTMPCNLSKHLLVSGHEHVVMHGAFWDTPEYKMVEFVYSQQTAKRSGVPLMRHIDEGIWILHQIGTELKNQNIANSLFVSQVVRAYALHPLVQDDESLKTNFYSLAVPVIGREALMYVMEYRNRANAYLSHHDPLHHRPDPGPLFGVEEMLIADKVQNYKDFQRYHKGTHPRSDRLDRYFKEWLAVLRVTDDQYQTWVDDLDKLNDLSTIITE